MNWDGSDWAALIGSVSGLVIGALTVYFVRRRDRSAATNELIQRYEEQVEYFQAELTSARAEIRALRVEKQAADKACQERLNELEWQVNYLRSLVSGGSGGSPPQGMPRP